MLLTATQFYSLTAGTVDPETECAFFAALKMRNGTFKLTAPGRFDAIEDHLAPFLRDTNPAIRNVLDVGASIGVTTVELAAFLKRLGLSAEIVGTDLFVDAHVVDIAPGLRVLCDGAGWPLQYDVGGRPWRAWIRRLDYATLMVLPRLLARTALRPRLRNSVAHGRTWPVKMEGRTLAEHGVRLVQDDIFVPNAAFVGAFDFVRVANVLNIGYFTREEIMAGLINIRDYCRGPGALIVVLRSEGQTHDGTLFELKSDGRLGVRARIGNGSEIETIALEMATSPCSTR